MATKPDGYQAGWNYTTTREVEEVMLGVGLEQLRNSIFKYVVCTTNREGSVFILRSFNAVSVVQRAV